MNIDLQHIEQVIINRRSTYPPAFQEQPIKKETIEHLLYLAHQAPNHKKTRPWRFKVFHSEAARQSLSDYLVEAFLKANEGKDYPQIKLKKTKEKPLKSGCVIAICMHRSTEVIIPEWEEIAAVACAVQNMWLACTALGIGAYWSSPSSITTAREFLNLKEEERCLGLFYMGYTDVMHPPADRGNVIDHIEFI